LSYPKCFLQIVHNLLTLYGDNMSRVIRRPGRPRVFKNRKQITFYVEDNVFDKLVELAHRNGVTLSEYLRRIIENHLKLLESS